MEWQLTFSLSGFPHPVVPVTPRPFHHQLRPELPEVSTSACFQQLEHHYFAWKQPNSHRMCSYCHADQGLTWWASIRVRQRSQFCKAILGQFRWSARLSRCHSMHSHTWELPRWQIWVWSDDRASHQRDLSCFRRGRVAEKYSKKSGEISRSSSTTITWSLIVGPRNIQLKNPTWSKPMSTKVLLSAQP